MNRHIPNEDAIGDLVQGALNDVGAQLEGIFKDPTVKKAYSILGKESGEVRHDSALRERVADKVLDQSPLAKKALEYFELTPMEGLQILNDPMLAPLIQGFLKGNNDQILGTNPSRPQLGRM